MSRRIWFIQTLFIIWVVILLARLSYWQIAKAQDLRIQADQEHTSSLIIPAGRGLILAGDGFPLVANKDNYLFYINPKQLPPPADLQPLLNILDALPGSDSAKSLLGEKLDPSLSWLAISRAVAPDIKAAIEKLNFPGLGFELQPARFYPEGSPSAYLTGFVGKDSQDHPLGYFGLEGYYDRQLSGTDGKIVEEKDAFGLPIVIGEHLRIPPREGRTLLSTIDRTVEFLAFQKLSEGLIKYQAISGTVTVLDSKTAQVLAMVSLPGYDPSDYTQYPSALYKNPIVSDSYEPGSTFKTIIMSGALDAKAINPTTTICDICSHSLVIDNYPILSGDGHYYPDSSMFDIIKHSDNIGMVFVSRKLGPEKQLEYIKNFGFGKPTGIDLQEESSPELRPENEWHSIDYATASFGQGIAVTPIQMVTAVNAIANQGVLISPRVITEVRSDKFTQTISPPPPHRVISQLSAAIMTEMMVNGVKNGEVRYYRPEGYMIAGKTGTAQVPIEGHYDKNKTIASFVGFAPADNPKFTMLVTLREPKVSPWGSTTAAPVWFNIARELFRYYQIPSHPGY